MPFGIPCPDPQVDDIPKLLYNGSLALQDIVYNITFPIGQGITVNEHIIALTHKRLRQLLKKTLAAGDNTITALVEGISSNIANGLNLNAINLAQAQSAIALLPQADTPDIPAADVRRPSWPAPTGDTATIVQGAVKQANADVNSLLSLLYLMGITPAQVRRYLEIGTIPDVYLCPNPDAHLPAEMPRADTSEPLPVLNTSQSVYGEGLAKPDLIADGLWDDE